VRYVENIRSYYDILAWKLEQDAPKTVPNLPSSLMAGNPAL